MRHHYTTERRTIMFANEYAILDAMRAVIKFTVSLTNFGINFPETFNSFEDAVEFAKTKGFEATIGYEPPNGVAGTWNPISGSCRWDKR